jgi:hypothetical protein
MKKGKTMNQNRFGVLARALIGVPSRRHLLRGLAGAGLGWGVARLPDATEAKKKRKKKHRKKRHKGNDGPTCGKAGSPPVRGKCCAGAVAVDGVCRSCDVCASGCAFSSVQAAIEASAPGATIAICPGRYREDLTINESVVTLVGAGDGEGAGDTIIRGTGQKSVVTIDEGIVTLERLRLTGGNPADSTGGGLNNRGTTKLIGCTVSGNAANYGGGIYHRTGVLTLTDCVVSGNLAGAQGGGIYVEFPPAATLELIGCKVRGNVAIEAGGGVFNRSTLHLTETEVSGNEAATGGGLLNNASNARITLDARSRVTGNTANSVGGGIYNSGTVTLASSANVSGNTPTNCAGDTVANCTG